MGRFPQQLHFRLHPHPTSDALGSPLSTRRPPLTRYHRRFPLRDRFRPGLVSPSRGPFTPVSGHLRYLCDVSHRLRHHPYAESTHPSLLSRALVPAGNEGADEAQPVVSGYPCWSVHQWDGKVGLRFNPPDDVRIERAGWTTLLLVTQYHIYRPHSLEYHVRVGAPAVEDGL